MNLIFQQAILDWHLYGIVLLLLVVDVVILSVWMIIAPFHLDITEASTQVSDDEKLLLDN